MTKRKSVVGVKKPAKVAKSDLIDEKVSFRSNPTIESAFLLKCGPDFFEFYDFCCTVDAGCPLDVFSDVLNLRLVGPFEVLHDEGKYKLDDDLTDCYRYFHDPPEMVTVMASDGEYPFHIGYYRSQPSDFPIFVVSSNPSESGELTIVGENIFSAVAKLLESKKKASKSESPLLSTLLEFAKQKGISINTKTPVKWKPTALTLNGVGFKIEIKNGIGYRPLPPSRGELLDLLEAATSPKNPNTTQLDELTNLVQFANDECDYGEGMELGLDLLAFHPRGSEEETFERASKLNRRISFLLAMAYHLAGREEFVRVVKRHMENRQRRVRRLKPTQQL